MANQLLKRKTYGYFYMRASIKVFLFAFFTVFVQFVHASDSDEKSLRTTFLALDRIIFEESFNQCKTQVLPPIISSDFEFYHDVSGLQNRTEFLKAVQSNICSNPDIKPIRKLVANSMEIFALKNNGEIYGAIQRGEHEFYIKETGKKLYKTGIAKFTHLWILNNGSWQLKRVLSFDHKSASD